MSAQPLILAERDTLVASLGCSMDLEIVLYERSDGEGRISLRLYLFFWFLIATLALACCCLASNSILFTSLFRLLAPWMPEQHLPLLLCFGWYANLKNYYSGVSLPQVSAGSPSPDGHRRVSSCEPSSWPADNIVC